MFQHSRRPSEEQVERLPRAEQRMPGEAQHAQEQTLYSPPPRAQHSNPPTPGPHTAHPTFTSPINQLSSPQQPGALPPISSTIFQRESQQTSRYYDPTSDHGDRSVERGQARFGPSPAAQSHQPFDSRPAELPQHSPVASAFPHHSPVQHHPNHISTDTTMPIQTEALRSPVSPQAYNANSQAPTSPAYLPQTRRFSQEAQQTPGRPADPMSLSSIMSGPDPQAKNDSPIKSSAPYVKQEMPPSFTTPSLNDQASAPAVAPTTPIMNGNSHLSTPVKKSSSSRVLAIDEREVEVELAKIEAMDLSDVEGPGFESEKKEYIRRGIKRQADVAQAESEKRKRRRSVFLQKQKDRFEAQAKAATEYYNQRHENEAWQQVQQEEIAEEKERKKDMQRKRRREKTLQNEHAKRDEAIALAQQAADDEEKERLLREAQKHDRKARATNQLLQGNTPSKDIRELTPLAPNLEGGAMSSFQLGEETPNSGSKRGRKGGNRPRKSKEQKLAEIEAAAAAQAAIERGEELPPITVSRDTRVDQLKLRPSYRDESTPESSVADFKSDYRPFESKGYNQIYEQIWKEIARKDGPKVVRLKNESISIKQSNHRKTAQLAAKEARRWQLRTNKSTKDVQARAKRSMREMLSFWKRNERDERDQRKLAEKLELENAKRAEAEREAARQRRKLNFLISQTELYSHFIGKKVKTDEIEKSTNDASVKLTEEADSHGEAGASAFDIPDDPSAVGGRVTNFDQLDFDAEDETALRQAAMANAQHAIQEAQDRARAFDGKAATNTFDDGEMNFQNPTSLQNMDVPQPKLLSCQLKEYQLKGLNWLVNLYEQGINGILADEMGLGKTVQSISVMAYLAETHNIWGPFLVVAPASTLHNWQQEITRFVPDVKVLPYWGNAKDRKVLRKFWDRKHITYTKDSPFHVLVTSYQLVVGDAQYFQKVKWQYMILDEAQAIKSSQSSRWKSLLSLNCRNRLLLTGTPIQNNMQELWALLHFIMPSLFDSHDEFSDWFSKDIESHAQSNTKLNEDQLRRLHMILKPFMLRRVKKHVQKELGDKIELDVFCDLTYRQRAYYTSLRNKISVMDLFEKAVGGDDQGTATLMNLVMQFRKVCNHPDLFERAETMSPLSFSHFAETASFMREGQNLNVAYSVRNLIEYRLPPLIARQGGRLNVPGPDNEKAGWRGKYLHNLMNIWATENIQESVNNNGAFSFLRFADVSAGEASYIARSDVFTRAIERSRKPNRLGRFQVIYDEEGESNFNHPHSLFNIVERNDRKPLSEVTNEGRLAALFNISRASWETSGLSTAEPGAAPRASAPPIELFCSNQDVVSAQHRDFFNVSMRQHLHEISEKTEQTLLETKVDTTQYPITNLMPPPDLKKSRFTHIQVPSMRRFVSDSGKLAKLDQLLRKLKEEGHRVLLYFQMTRMIDLMEEYLTYRNYKYCRLDGSTSLEDRRDTVADFQTRPEIFIFLLSTRAGGLGINLTSADTVIFYDSDWNPTIDSQAMDRAHRLGQTRQVTVYRLITRNTIEERIRKRALQKEEVQRVVISGGAGAHVDFNTRSRENRTKDIAMWLADDEQAAEIEKKEAELAEREANQPQGKRRRKAAAATVRKEVNLDDMYHEGEGHFDDGSAGPSGAATPLEGPVKRRKGISKKAKTAKQRLAIADGSVDV